MHLLGEGSWFPLGLMNEKIEAILGKAIGDVEEVETNGAQLACERYLKVKVSINVSNKSKFPLTFQNPLIKEKRLFWQVAKS